MLRARCQSFLDAVGAFHGQAPSPSCATTSQQSSQPDEILTCPTCGWSLSWRDYFGTIQHKQLSGAEPVMVLFQGFVNSFPTAVRPQEKMLLIDGLIHGFHWFMLNETETRTTAIKLIEGRYHEVVYFLDQLTYGPDSTAGTRQAWQAWCRVIQRTAEQWRDERLKRPPEPPVNIQTPG